MWPPPGTEQGLLSQGGETGAQPGTETAWARACSSPDVVNSTATTTRMKRAGAKHSWRISHDAPHTTVTLDVQGKRRMRPSVRIWEGTDVGFTREVLQHGCCNTKRVHKPAEDNSKDRTGVDSQEARARNQNMRRWEAAARGSRLTAGRGRGASEPRDRPPERRLHEQDGRHAQRLGTCGQDSGRVRSSSPRRRPPAEWLMRGPVRV